jgi:hypothetical protein
MAAAKRSTTIIAWALIMSAPPLTCAVSVALAEDAAPANTLVELRRQFGGCLAKTPLGPAGSQMTISFMMKRDGSVFGKPRVTFSHLEGDAETRRGFMNDAERAVDACLPLKVTPSLGGAIAGRQFFMTLGRSKPEQRI